MPMQSRGSSGNARAWWKALIATTVVGLFLVFWLPTRFPPPPALSESYVFGFNNHLCEMLFGGLLVCIAVLTKLGGLKFPSVGGRTAAETADSFEQANRAGGLTVRLLVICLATSAVMCALVYWAVSGLGGINDGVYYLDRIHLIARGELPYRDFEFLYGSTPLYGSLALGRMLHTSAENGYYLIWGGGTVLGIFLLWQSIRWLELPAEGKRRVFLLYTVVFLLMIPLATLNYYSLRYTLPLFAITGLYRLDRGTSFVRRAAVILFGVGVTAALFGTSPEMAIVYVVAVCLYLPLRRYFTQRPFAIDMLVLLAAMAGVVAVEARAGTFKSMASFSAGAWNLPVYPGLAILFAFACVLAMVFYLATRTPAEWARSNVAFAVIYGLGMLPGALGRCDDTHVAGYLLSILVCAMLLSRLWLPMWRVATIGFAIVFIAVSFGVGLRWRAPVLRKAFLYHLYQADGPHGRVDIAVDHLIRRATLSVLGEQRGEAKMDKVRSFYSQNIRDPRAVFPGVSAVVAVPFEYSPNELNNYQAPWVDEGYYMGPLNIMTSRDVERKTNELRMHPAEDLVVPEKYCQGYDFNLRTLVGYLLLVPWVPPQKHPMSTLDPYCAYIHQNYDVLYPASETTFGYGVLRRKPGR